MTMDDRLAYMDQGSFLGLRALGHQPSFHATWTYDRALDLDAVCRFNENLAATLLGRVVERSRLPGGRHRWSAIDAVPQVEVEAVPRARDDIHAWSDEFAERGTDPEHGPGWRLGVLPLTDGGAAVSLIVPHTLGDGLCVLQALADAVDARVRRPPYPSRGVRRVGAVLGADLLGLVRTLLAVPRALLASVRVARAQAVPKAARVATPAAGSAAPPPVGPAAPPTATTAPFRAPVACVRMSQVAWDVAAAERGGTSNTLVAAVAARLGARLGRTGRDGLVTLAVPVSVRVDGDTRANALEAATIRIDPAGLPGDLTGLRRATKQALIATSERSSDVVAALPLVPLMPAFAVRRAEATAMGAAARPVGCSNYGDLPAAVARIDGRDADDFWVRLNEVDVEASDLDRIGGQLYLLSGRCLGRVFLSVVGYPVGGRLDSAELGHLLDEVLADFGLTAALAAR